MRLSEQALFSEAVIRERVCELGARISLDYAGRELMLVTVLKGGILFAADLMRRITVPVTVSFVRARSYDGTQSLGAVEFTYTPEDPLTGKHLLVVEDILDMGRTTAATIARLEAQQPASVALCTLLDKQVRRAFDVEAAYVGFQVEDQFVVGYGLDYNERYRELPAIHVLEDAD